MPDPFKQNVDVYFVFDVTTKSGIASGNFGQFISDIVDAGIKLRSLSGFVSGRKTKVFCVPDDAKMFRAFAKKRGLRARQKRALIYTGGGGMVGVVRSSFIEATRLSVVPAFSFSSRGEAFIYQDKRA